MVNKTSRKKFIAGISAGIAGLTLFSKLPVKFSQNQQNISSIQVKANPLSVQRSRKDQFNG